MSHDARSPSPSPERPAGGPELRLQDRRAFVGFPPLEVAPGVVVRDFALQVPDVTFPFNVTGGATRFQRQKLLFGELEVELSGELVRRKLAEAAGRAGGLSEVVLHFRPGHLEGEARLPAAGHAPLTFKLALDGLGPELAAWVYDVRLYAPVPLAAAQVPALLVRALAGLDVLPDVKPRGASGFTARVLEGLVEVAAVSRGFKVPDVDRAQLAQVEVSARGIVLRFTAAGLPPPAVPDETLLLQLEGARAFAEAEGLLADGRLAEARDAYLRAGDVADAHPFAVERLLQLLAADPGADAMALDVAELLTRRRPSAAAPLWAEAVVRERRGEKASAAERYLALSLQARAAGELASAFLAAEAAARLASQVAPALAVCALHELLGLRPDHLPSLQALARASDASGDRASSLRAWRRISALARDVRHAAEAHVQLARLTAEGAPAELSAARLHCEAALRLQPDLLDALELLGELCLRAGEHLRALRAVDRLRELALARHELDRVATASAMAGRAWETGPAQLDNALLRYREAANLRPADAVAHAGVARVAQRLGRWQEALASAQQAVELAGASPVDAVTRAAAHQSWHILAGLYAELLREPARAQDALAQALALEPADTAALSVLVPAWRAAGRSAELADALEKLARTMPSAPDRAQLYAEAGELYRTRLGRPEAAARLHALALEAQPAHRSSLEALLALAEASRDAASLCRCLRALADLEAPGPERNRFLRRLSVAAREVGDLERASAALSELLATEPADLAALGELRELLRRRGEVSALAQALSARAAAAEAAGEIRLAASTLRELAEVQAQRLGKRVDALGSLERAVSLLPDPAVLLELGTLQLQCDRPEAARRVLEDALARLPAHAPPERVAEVRARLGEALEVLGETEAAREQCARAFALRPLDDALAGRLERLYRAAGLSRELAHVHGRRAEALRGAGRSEEAAGLFFESGRALVALADKGGAAQRLTEALACGPSADFVAEALRLLAQLALERGAQVEAAELQARLAALQGDGREAARWLVGAARLVDDVGRRKALLEQALSRAPLYAPARLAWGQLRAEAEPLAALEDVEAACAVPAESSDGLPDAERVPALSRAVKVAEAAGQWETARRLLGLLAKATPGDRDTLASLLALHRRAGAREAEAEVLGRLLEVVGPDEALPLLRDAAALRMELGQLSSAAQAAREWLRRAPGDAEAAAVLLRASPPDAVEDRRLALEVLLANAPTEPERASLRAQAAALPVREVPVSIGALEEEVARRRAEGPPTEALAEACGRLAEQEMRRGRLELAESLFEEQAGLWEQLGRADAALSALLRVRQLREDEGDEAGAAAVELRRAVLYRDARFDLAAAEECLLKSFELQRAVEVARAGAELARRREDAAAEADWLDRQLLVVNVPTERSAVLLQLAALFLDKLSAPRPAEAAAREAVRLHPDAPEAAAVLARAQAAVAERA